MTAQESPWKVNWLSSLPEQDRQAFLSSLTPEEATALTYNWRFWARDSQETPPGDWVVWLILAGRGFGKTRVGAEWIREQAQAGIYSHLALIGQTAADVRDVMVEGESGLLAISPPDFKPHYEPSKRRLTWPNGVRATTFSGDEPDQLRGPQHHKVWADEPAKWRYLQQAWDNMEMGLRLGSTPQVVATTTPRPIPLIRTLIADKQTVVTQGNTYENLGNLAPSFIARIIRKYEGTRLGRQELNAEILDDNPGALWKRSRIEELRVTSHPDLYRIVVAIDPAVADPAVDADEKTAETGIIVVGISGDADPHAYVLDDKTLQGTPNEWALEAVTAFRKYRADLIVGEVNNGGAMVEFTIQTVAKDTGVRVPYKAVHASRGKHTRAEPVSALYEQGRVHHVGSFPDLEDQLCSWEPGMKSPDRMDALVWAITELMLEEEGDPVLNILPHQMIAGVPRRY